MTFKPGDRVVALDSCGGAYTKGRTYVVKAIRRDRTYQSGWCVLTVQDDSMSGTNGWCSRFFKLAAQQSKRNLPEWF
jgi:hypothetical protein